MADLKDLAARLKALLPSVEENAYLAESVRQLFDSLKDSDQILQQIGNLIRMENELERQRQQLDFLHKQVKDLTEKIKTEPKEPELDPTSVFSQMFQSLREQVEEVIPAGKDRGDLLEIIAEQEKMALGAYRQLQLALEEAKRELASARVERFGAQLGMDRPAVADPARPRLANAPTAPAPKPSVAPPPVPEHSQAPNQDDVIIRMSPAPPFTISRSVSKPNLFLKVNLETVSVGLARPIRVELVDTADQEQPEVVSVVSVSILEGEGNFRLEKGDEGVWYVHGKKPTDRPGKIHVEAFYWRGDEKEFPSADAEVKVVPTQPVPSWLEPGKANVAPRKKLVI